MGEVGRATDVGEKWTKGKIDGPREDIETHLPLSALPLKPRRSWNWHLLKRDRRCSSEARRKQRKPGARELNHVNRGAETPEKKDGTRFPVEEKREKQRGGKSWPTKRETRFHDTQSDSRRLWKKKENEKRKKKERDRRKKNAADRQPRCTAAWTRAYNRDDCWDFIERKLWKLSFLAVTFVAGCNSWNLKRPLNKAAVGT